MKYVILSAGQTIVAELAFMEEYHSGDFAEVPEPPVRPSVPQTVTMRQARLVLHKHGLLAAVDTAIAAQEEPLRGQMLIEWTFATAVDRQWPMMLALGAALGLTSEQVDALFIEASVL